MKRIKRETAIKRNVHITFCVCMVFILVSLTLSVEGCTKMKDDVYINNISFSPDGKKILFDHRKGNDSLRINCYDLETASLSAYQPPKNEIWAMARYSFDGKKIVFLAIPVIDGKQDLQNTQIATMDSEGKNIKKNYKHD